MRNKRGFVGILELIILLLFFGDFRRFFAVFDIHFHGELSPHYRRQTAFYYCRFTVEFNRISTVYDTLKIFFIIYLVMSFANRQ